MDSIENIENAELCYFFYCSCSIGEKKLIFSLRFFFAFGQYTFLTQCVAVETNRKEPD